MPVFRVISWRDKIKRESLNGKFGSLKRNLLRQYAQLLLVVLELKWIYILHNFREKTIVEFAQYSFFSAQQRNTDIFLNCKKAGPAFLPIMCL